MPARIAFVGQGDARDPRWWSGIPAMLIPPLEALGFDIDVVDAWGGPRGARERLARIPHLPAAFRHHGPPGWRETSARLAELGPTAWRARHRNARRSGPVLPTMAMRGWVELEPGTPYVVLDDETMSQAFDVDHAGMGAAPPRLRRSTLRRQSEVFRGAIACCAASRWAASSLTRDHGVPAERIHVVGLPSERIPEEPSYHRSSPRFLFIGLDWERKNGALVVEAFRRLRDELPDARLDLIGGHPRIDAPGVTGHGRLPRNDPNAQRRKRELLRQATCFVLPSSSEAFGVAHVEAGNYGMPSIGTTVGGVADSIGPGGVLVPPHELEPLLDAMRRLAQPAESIALGRAAREHSALFTPDLVARRLLQQLVPGAVEPVPDVFPVTPLREQAAAPPATR